MTESLADKTIRNMDELFAAAKAYDGPHNTVLEQQRLSVQKSMHRCRRCGDFAPAPLVSAPLTIICDKCEAELKANEKPKAMWFVDMVAAINSKQSPT